MPVSIGYGLRAAERRALRVRILMFFSGMRILEQNVKSNVKVITSNVPYRAPTATA